jgi:hypothetical protein
VAGAILAMVTSACGDAAEQDDPEPTTTSLAPATTGAPTTSAAPPDSPAPTSTAAPTTESPTTSMPRADHVVSIDVVGDTVTVADDRIEVALGDSVLLVVTVDGADEIHLHGYDVFADVAAGGTAELAFTADIPGVFEVELEQRRIQLLEIVVR